MPSGTKRVKSAKAREAAKTDVVVRQEVITREADERRELILEANKQAEKDQLDAFNKRQAETKKMIAEEAKTRREEAMDVDEDAGVEVTNPTDKVLSFDWSGETYMLKPGKNTLISRTPHLTSMQLGAHAQGALGIFGVTHKEPESGTKRRRLGGEIRVSDQLVTDDARAVIAVPASQYEGYKAVSNPSADERAQPIRIDTQGNEMDPDGLAGKRTRDALVRQHEESEEGSGKKARGKASSRGV